MGVLPGRIWLLVTLGWLGDPCPGRRARVRRPRSRLGRRGSTACRSWPPGLLEEWELVSRRRADERLDGARAPGPHPRRRAGGAQAGLPRRGGGARAPRPAALGWQRRGPAAARRSGAAGDAARAAAPARPDGGVGPRGVRDRGRPLRPHPRAGACLSCGRRRRTSSAGPTTWPSCPAARRSRTGWSSRPCRCGRDFVTDAASTGTMIHGDLHYENVLAADREPWLVIDPKPTNGDPHYEVAPLLWNRWEELAAENGQTSAGECAVVSSPSSTRRAGRGPRPRLGDRADDPQRHVGDRGPSPATPTPTT